MVVNDCTVGTTPRTNGLGGTTIGSDNVLKTTLERFKFAAVHTVGVRVLVYPRSVLVVDKCPSGLPTREAGSTGAAGIHHNVKEVPKKEGTDHWETHLDLVDPKNREYWETVENNNEEFHKEKSLKSYTTPRWIALENSLTVHDKDLFAPCGVIPTGDEVAREGSVDGHNIPEGVVCRTSV